MVRDGGSKVIAGRFKVAQPAAAVLTSRKSRAMIVNLREIQFLPRLFIFFFYDPLEETSLHRMRRD